MYPTYQQNSIYIDLIIIKSVSLTTTEIIGQINSVYINGILLGFF